MASRDAAEQHPVAVAGEPQAPRQVAHWSGPPVDPFAPTIYGPPVGPDRFARPYPAPDLAPRRVEGYRVVAPPVPPSAARQSGCLRGLAVVASLVVLALLAGGALAATGHPMPQLGSIFGQATVPVATPTVRPTATPACPAPPVDAQAGQALDQVRLSTGVVGSALQPTDNVSALVVGQTLHVVFHVASAAGGVVNATFCTNGAISTSSHPLTVPAGFATRLGQNARGQFYLKLTSGSVGPGLVTLTWNGAVAAVMPFTVSAEATPQPQEP